MLEVYVDGSDKPVKFQRYQELAVTKEEKKVGNTVYGFTFMIVLVCVPGFLC